MGSGRWDPRAWAGYTRATASKTVDDIYSTRSAADLLTSKPELLPKDPATGLARERESRDSVDNPASTPIIVGIDVTGSMGILAETLVRKGLGVLFEEVLKRKPVSDPHVMFMAIGDANYDRVPLQISQFEADLRVVEQLTGVYLEHGGGGNAFESYNLPWYFAGQHTHHDAHDKRGRKGYLFTVGDEEAPRALTKAQIQAIVGDELPADVSPAEALQMAERLYHVFHVIVEEGSHARSDLAGVTRSWTNLIGQRVLRMSDHTKMSEIIVSAIEVNEGADKAAVAGSWSGDTSVVVRDALASLVVGSKLPDVGGVVRF